MSSGAVTTQKLRRRHGHSVHALQNRVRDLKTQLADKRRPFQFESQQHAARATMLQIELKLARYLIDQLPDATERAAVQRMGFLGRLRWALGVAWAGAFRWQREAERELRARGGRGDVTRTASAVPSTTEED